MSTFFQRPLTLLSITGISLILTNTLARLLFFSAPTPKGLLIRSLLVLVLAVMATSRLSWQQLTQQSWTYQTMKHIFED